MKVGIGLILNDDTSAQITSLENEISRIIGLDSGLKQPPHITIKSPFDVPDMTRILDFFEVFANTVEPIHVSMSGFCYFEPTTAYIAVNRNKDIYNLHKRLLAELESNMDIKPNIYEGDNIVFHTSTAINMSKEQYERAYKHLSKLPLVTYETVIDKIGLLVLKEETNNWIIYQSLSLSS